MAEHMIVLEQQHAQLAKLAKQLQRLDEKNYFAQVPCRTAP